MMNVFKREKFAQNLITFVLNTKEKNALDTNPNVEII